MSVTVIIQDTHVPDQAQSISVVGTTITITPATDGTGTISSTTVQLATLVNSTPAAAALVTATPHLNLAALGGTCSPPPGGNCYIGDPEAQGILFTLVPNATLTLTFKGMKVFPAANA